MKEKNEAKQFLHEEGVALKDKLNGKSYVLSDFSFSFKKSPKYEKEFKEILVEYLYRDQIITYYIFVDRDYDDKAALDKAKFKIKNLIKSGEMREYAKYYYHKFC